MIQPPDPLKPGHLRSMTQTSFESSLNGAASNADVQRAFVYLIFDSDLSHRIPCKICSFDQICELLLDFSFNFLFYWLPSFIQIRLFSCQRLNVRILKVYYLRLIIVWWFWAEKWGLLQKDIELGFFSWFSLLLEALDGVFSLGSLKFWFAVVFVP